ncbi:glycosyltransferase family 2 protein [Desulfatirhabdium butyrativorans]|uniref:glycosyltransferase family 2 protein n=1 Tax=Desulfatirhabdium butyrativorans TaxID=340467 RepID=UPI000403E507|nr:glycosyltransferase family 2 protein [Desulfatirhabdium butyrativorans]
MGKKLISIMSNCFNEALNVEELHRQVVEQLRQFPQYEYELIFVDNCSTDGTVDRIRSIIAVDPNVRCIVNARNFGQVRSPFHGLLQTRGAAVISMAADLQDPPALLGDFIRKWEEGYAVVVGVKEKTRENFLMDWARRLYYRLLATLSESPQIENFTGFGLYDRSFIEVLRQLDETNPYFRGLVAELGWRIAQVSYTQPLRCKGKSSNSLLTLYDLAMLGFVNHSRLPLRLASIFGFLVATFALLTALGYLIYKLFYWDTFQLGMAPLLIGIFLFGGLQLFFLGLIGEYIGVIYSRVRRRPLVIEQERLNFPSQEE